MPALLCFHNLNITIIYYKWISEICKKKGRTGILLVMRERPCYNIRCE